MLRISILLFCAGLLLAQDARAGCCRVVKVDTETATTVVRVCESVSDGSCGGLLFSGSLAIGEDQPICAPTPTIVYQEWDAAAGAFAVPVEAVCEGGDVEL